MPITKTNDFSVLIENINFYHKSIEQIAYNFEHADKFVHYFLTGEHKLPEKKE